MAMKWMTLAMITMMWKIEIQGHRSSQAAQRMFDR
jgi:hypothetical protein